MKNLKQSIVFCGEMSSGFKGRCIYTQSKHINGDFAGYYETCRTDK
jgi:hypothetical protein